MQARKPFKRTGQARRCSRSNRTQRACSRADSCARMRPIFMRFKVSKIKAPYCRRNEVVENLSRDVAMRTICRVTMGDIEAALVSHENHLIKSPPKRAFVRAEGWREEAPNVQLWSQLKVFYKAEA
jgi:hypothetical protein